MSGEGNCVDFGARIYDSRLGRWMSCDALEKEYPFLSPLSFCANNPIKFIDPDGKEIRISGDMKFQDATLSAMQKLTNDELKIDHKTGIVKIIRDCKANCVNKNLESTSMFKDNKKLVKY